RCRSEKSVPLVLPGAKDNERAVKLVEIVDVGRAGGRKVAVLGEIRSFPELNAAHQLRDQKVGIGVPLAMSMGRQVDRYTCDRRREVRTMVEIKPPQVVLVRFALAAVLADDHSGNRLENFTGPHDGTRIQLLGRDGAFAAGSRNAYNVLGGVGEIGKIPKC